MPGPKPRGGTRATQRSKSVARWCRLVHHLPSKGAPNSPAPAHSFCKDPQQTNTICAPPNTYQLHTNHNQPAPCLAAHHSTQQFADDPSFLWNSSTYRCPIKTYLDESLTCGISSSCRRAAPRISPSVACSADCSMFDTSGALPSLIAAFFALWLTSCRPTPSKRLNIKLAKLTSHRSPQAPSISF